MSNNKREKWKFEDYLDKTSIYSYYNGNDFILNKHYSLSIMLKDRAFMMGSDLWKYISDRGIVRIDDGFDKDKVLAEVQKKMLALLNASPDCKRFQEEVECVFGNLSTYIDRLMFSGGRGGAYTIVEFKNLYRSLGSVAKMLNDSYYKSQNVNLKKVRETRNKLVEHCQENKVDFTGERSTHTGDYPLKLDNDGKIHWVTVFPCLDFCNIIEALFALRKTAKPSNKSEYYTS